ncbi:MAG: hypothetical protein HZB99_00430 [Candidatus Harrisonbacteria bacterium]|nr:hypothetical protein [Candidatus Harrisonbacteria bacterium]
MEKKMAVDRLIHALKEGGIQSSLELEARTRLKPEELLPLLKGFQTKQLITVYPFLPCSCSGDEWNRTYYAPLPRFWRYIEDPVLVDMLREIT